MSEVIIYGLNAIEYEETPPVVDITYQQIPYSGTKIEYNTYDEYWQKANGVLNRTSPSLSSHTAELDYDSAEPFYTLKVNNKKGNKFRFTNNTDGAASVLGDTYAIDHLYGIGYGLVGLPIDNYANQVAAAQTQTVGGFNDYYLANLAMLMTIKDYSIAVGANEPTFFNLPASAIYPSTHRPNSVNVMASGSVGQFFQVGGTQTYTGIIWRKHY